jgi:hypothetical protein
MSLHPVARFDVVAREGEFADTTRHQPIRVI